jgi:hypothetical protein
VPNFFKWERHPAGVQPPLHLYTRYCVYADLFRLGYDGRLTTFGEAYQNTVDSKWGQKTQEFAQQHSTSKGNGGGGGSYATGTNIIKTAGYRHSHGSVSIERLAPL